MAIHCHRNSHIAGAQLSVQVNTQWRIGEGGIPETTNSLTPMGVGKMEDTILLVTEEELQCLSLKV